MCCNQEQKPTKQTNKLGKRYEEVHNQQRRSITFQEQHQKLNQQIQKLKQNEVKLKQAEDQLVERYAIAAKNQRISNQKRQKFKTQFEIDLIQNSKKTKDLIMRLNQAKDMGEVQELNVKQNNLQIQFKSIHLLFDQNSQQNAYHKSKMLTEPLSLVYRFYIDSQVNHKRLILTVTFYLQFVTQIISKGYSQSNQIKLKHQRITLKQIGNQLYDQFEALINLAKGKFTKERSRILDQGSVDSNHEQLKLRNKIEELQQRVQILLSEKEKLSGENNILLSNTIPSLREQLNKKELKEINQIKGVLVQVKNNTISKQDIEEILQKRFEGATIIYSNEEVGEIIKEKEETIQRLTAKIMTMQKQKSMLSEETESQNRRQMFKELQEKDNEIKKVKQQSKVKLQDKENQIRKLQNQVKAKEQQTGRLKGQLSRQAGTIKQQVQTIKEQVQTIQEQTQAIKQQRQTIQNSQANNNQTQTIRELEQNTQQRADTIKQQTQTIQRQAQTIRQLQLLQSKPQPIRPSFDISSEQIKKLQRDLEELNFKLTEVELQANIAKTDKFQLEQKIKSLTIDIKNKEKKIIKLENEINIVQKQKTLLENNIKAYEIELNEHKSLAKILQKKLDQIPIGHSRVRSISFVKHMVLFSGSLLQSRKDEKKFLMSSIQKHMGMQIEKTQKIYDYKRDHATNFHKFVDGHSNIVLIVQTQKALVSCFYSGLYEEGIPMVEQALILSLDSRKYYKLNNFKNYPNKDPKDQRSIRGMVYDSYYIIFGNAQVRIRTGEETVFSNFGIANSYFNSQRDKVSQLLKEGSKNEVNFINYEIHEVLFNQQHYLQMLE